MLAVAKEEFEALKKRNFRLIFIIGAPGSGKSALCTRLVNDFKWTHINIDKLIDTHKSNKTKLGEFILNQPGLTSEVLIKVLVQAIITTPSKTYIVEGFPKSLEDALQFERQIKEISLIINLYLDEDIAHSRMDHNDKNTIKVFHERSNDLISFYEKYGIVRQVNTNADIAEVYETLKETIYPRVYLIVGKKYSGKTTISNFLCERMGMKYFDFIKDFSKSKDESASAVMNILINKLRDETAQKVLIEDFPLKKDFINYFQKNCKKFEKVIFLNIEDENAYERMIKSSSEENVGCSTLNSLLYDFDSKKEVINYLRKGSFLEVNVNNHLKLVLEDLLASLAPSLLLFSHNSKEDTSLDFKKDLVNHFVTKLNYQQVDVLSIVEENIKRQTSNGKILEKCENKINYPIELLLGILKPILFSVKNTKFILNNFPTSQISDFEKKICKVSKLIYISNTIFLPIDDNSIELHMKKDNRLFVYNKSSLDDYVVNDILNLNRDVTVVYGMPLSGKTKISDHLKKQYNYTMIDFVEFITELKKAKGMLQDPPEPDGLDITGQELIDGFKKHFSNLKLNEKVLLENIFGKHELMAEIDVVKKIFEITGRPRQVFELDCREDVLINRWKESKGITEEITEDQKNEFMETLDKPKKILEHLKSLAFKITPVDTNYSESESKLNFDNINGRKMIVIKHDYDIDLVNSLSLFSACFQTLLVSVPDLIAAHFYKNTEIARRLYDTYSKKEIECNGLDASSNYVKYNPIYFDENLVNEIITNFINENSKEIEDSGNFIILAGYLNNDLFSRSELGYNLPLYEVKKLISLGK
jgi:adenylate kinase family enzyme